MAALLVFAALLSCVQAVYLGSCPAYECKDVPLKDFVGKWIVDAKVGMYAQNLCGSIEFSTLNETALIVTFINNNKETFGYLTHENNSSLNLVTFNWRNKRNITPYCVLNMDQAFFIHYTCTERLHYLGAEDFGMVYTREDNWENEKTPAISWLYQNGSPDMRFKKVRRDTCKPPVKPQENNNQTSS